MDNKASVLLTIHYSDLFDFPVTENEIWQYFIGNTSMTRSELHGLLGELMRKEISYKAPYYCLRGKEKIFALRKKRQLASVEKIKQLTSLVASFRFIPTLRYVGISGSLARMNAEKRDDIDLFIITEKNTVWITRLVLLFVLQIMGKRRTRFEKIAPDKICLNFLLDIRQLHFQKERQEIYTAYEIAQLQSLYDRANTYAAFLKANVWMKKYVPHIAIPKQITILKESYWTYVLCDVCRLLEPLARSFQLWVLKKHTTSEIVQADMAAFHPRDYRQTILRQFSHLASKKASVASKSTSLWDIDKGTSIIYTRKDYTVSPNNSLERFSFENYG